MMMQLFINFEKPVRENLRDRKTARKLDRRYSGESIMSLRKVEARRMKT
jgi:hypothetical protein